MGRVPRWPMRIYHVATANDWDAAKASGSYTTSTYGVTLEQEGFLHASRADQWQGVLDRFYSEVTEPLVLLEICLLYTSPSPRDRTRSRMPSSA